MDKLIDIEVILYLLRGIYLVNIEASTEPSPLQYQPPLHGIHNEHRQQYDSRNYQNHSYNLKLFLALSQSPDLMIDERIRQPSVSIEQVLQLDEKLGQNACLAHGKQVVQPPDPPEGYDQPLVTGVHRDRDLRYTHERAYKD